MQRNERGYRIGEGHHRSTIPDAVVREMRQLHECGRSYGEIVRVFGERGRKLSYYTVKAICSYRRRVPDWRCVR